MIKMIFVKPVSYTSYITAKWVSVLLLSLGSVILGMLAAWYYTVLLIDDFPIGRLLMGTGLYFIWILLILTFTVFLSSRLKSSGLVAVCSFIFSIILPTLTSLLDKWMKWSPAMLTSTASEIFTKGKVDSPLLLPLIVTGVLVTLFLYLAASNQKTEY